MCRHAKAILFSWDLCCCLLSPSLPLQRKSALCSQRLAPSLFVLFSLTAQNPKRRQVQKHQSTPEPRTQTDFNQKDVAVGDSGTLEMCHGGAVPGGNAARRTGSGGFMFWGGSRAFKVVTIIWLNNGPCQTHSHRHLILWLWRFIDVMSGFFFLIKYGTVCSFLVAMFFFQTWEDWIYNKRDIICSPRWLMEEKKNPLPTDLKTWGTIMCLTLDFCV